MKKNWLKRVLFATLALVALAIIGFVLWAATPLGPMPEALEALQNGEGVQVDTTQWLTFAPQNIQPETGLILYPGGRVDARSYAPLARKIAAQGYLVVIPPMPLNFAFLAADRAADVMVSHPEIQRWVIGGHSLGGAMAARFAYQYPEMVAGLVLWASYPPDDNSLADSSLPVLSIYGTEDMGLEGIETRKNLLPPHTVWAVIEGGNHAQIGWYGDQPGDNPASISREEQQTQLLSATLAFLEELQSRSQ